MSNLIEVAIAIIYSPAGFLMQLRDNIPGINYPGYWGLFGGHLEPNEMPEAALKRELLEEIGYQLPRDICKFCEHEDDRVKRYIFAVPLTVELNQLTLLEGWDMKLLTLADIERGECYSEKAGMVRPIGPPHQQFILDFVIKHQ